MSMSTMSAANNPVGVPATCAHLTAIRLRCAVVCLSLLSSCAAWHARPFDQGSFRQTNAWISLGTIALSRFFTARSRAFYFAILSLLLLV